MADLVNIGLTGLRAHQVALSVTGNNVANTNTPGYSRQEAIFEDNLSLPTGAGFQGQGVSIETIRRISQGFVVEQVRQDTSVFNERDALLNEAESVDNLLAGETTGLTASLSRFFAAFQGGADDPTSVPQRQLLLSQTEGLISRFGALDSRLNTQLANIDQELEAAVAKINSISESLANLNQSISVAAGTGDEPNKLLDERDENLRQLSELVSVTVFPQGDDGRVNVFIGNGQPLVVGNNNAILTTVASPVESNKLDIAFDAPSGPQVITTELTGGKIGGLLDFRDNDLTQAINSLGRIAVVLADTVNDQHALGLDLENNLGGLFFNDVNDLTLARSRVFNNGNNVPPANQVMRVEIRDTTQLTNLDYEVRFEGPTDDDFVVVALGENEVLARSSLQGVFPAGVELDGFEIVFESGNYKQGDRFTVQPVRNGATDISQVIDRVEELAFASPIRSNSSLGNTGNAVISQGLMLDVENPNTNQTIPIFSTPGQLTPPLGIQFIRDNLYEIVDLTDPANPVPLVPPRNNQLYTQGVTNDLFTSDPGETLVVASGPDTQVVPAPVASPGPFANGYGAQNLSFLTRDLDTGIVTSSTVAIAADSSAETIATQMRSVPGVQVTAYTEVNLDSFVDTGTLGLTVNGEVLTVTAPDVFGPDALETLINSNTNLQSQNIYAVSDGVSLSIRAFTGADVQVEVTGGAGESIDVSKIDPYSPGKPPFGVPTTVNAGDGVAVGGALDVTMAEGISFTADVATVFEQAPVARSTYYGFEFTIQGEARQGDKFNIGFNLDGVSDNRNALAIANLAGSGQIGNGVVSYGEAYAQIVEEIGVVTNRARLDSEAAEALLTQSTNTRDSISGVNLDEEAGRLIQFQSAYNASAQVVSVAQELFDTLLSTFR